MRVKNLMVAVDFSSQSELALAQAIQLARRVGAALTLVHAEPYPGAAVMSAEPIMIPPQLTERLRSDRNEQLGELARRVSEDNPDLTIQPLLKSGETAEAIVEAARHLGADLIALGSHGAGGVDRFLLGSVTEKVSRRAPCPVLVVRGDAEHPRSFRRVLIATDFSSFAPAQVKAAQALAGPEAELELVHAWAPLHYDGLFTLGGGGPQDDLGRIITEGESAAAAALSALADDLDLPEARRYIEPTTSAASGVLDRARSIDADLIVIGAHDSTGVANAIGTVADRIMRHAECPVLLIPEEARARLEAPTPRSRPDAAPAPH